MRLIPGWRFTIDAMGRRAIEVKARVTAPWDMHSSTELITEIMYDENNFERMWVTPNQDSGSYTAEGKTLGETRAFSGCSATNSNESRDNEKE